MIAKVWHVADKRSGGTASSDLSWQIDGNPSSRRRWLVYKNCLTLMRYGEDHVEIAGVEEFAFPCRQPALARLCLTLGTVAIATRVVGDGLIPATRASIAMPAEGGSAAALNGTKGFELLIIFERLFDFIHAGY